MHNTHNPTILQRILALLSIPTAAAAFLYVTCGRGFVWDPWAYTIAWLTLIAALAYGVPMLDTTIDTCAIIWRSSKRRTRASSGPRRTHRGRSRDRWKTSYGSSGARSLTSNGVSATRTPHSNTHKASLRVRCPHAGAPARRPAITE